LSGAASSSQNFGAILVPEHNPNFQNGKNQGPSRAFSHRPSVRVAGFIGNGPKSGFSAHLASPVKILVGFPSVGSHFATEGAAYRSKQLDSFRRYW
jgi:hypothetical protein